MGRIPAELRENIARNIKAERIKKFPGKGGGKLCAETFGVTPQQWSPWERGMRTPDEYRLLQIAEFFGCSVEHLRRGSDATEVRRVAPPMPEPLADISTDFCNGLKDYVKSVGCILADGQKVHLDIRMTFWCCDESREREEHPAPGE